MTLISLLAKYKLLLALAALTLASTFVYIQVSRSYNYVDQSRNTVGNKGIQEIARKPVHLIENVMDQSPEIQFGRDQSTTSNALYEDKQQSNDLQRQLDIIWNKNNEAVTKAVNLSSEISIKRPPEPSKYNLIPNIVHFVRYNGKQKSLDFTELVSIKSVHNIQKPDVIYLHCDFQPSGQYWIDFLGEGQVQIKVMETPAPQKIGDLDIDTMTLVNDVRKLEVLKEYGGIVVETDVIIIQSLDPLRKYNFSIGQQKDPLMGLGVILANKDSFFLDIALNALIHPPTFGPKLQPSSLMYSLWQKNIEFLHVEKDTLTTPDLHERHLIFSNSDIFRYWKNNLYVVHFRFQNNEAAIYDAEYIKSLKNLIGQVLRYIYFGSSDLIDKNLPHIMYASKPP